MRITLFLLLATVRLAAEVLISEADAVKIAIPNADSVRVEEKQLSPEQRNALQHDSGLRFTEPRFRFLVGLGKTGTPVGYAVVMNEIGKEEFITFLVGVTPKGEVGEVLILEYRESRGAEVKEKRFMRQFRGKKRSDPIQVDRDIANYTGATLSSHAIARGVKKALLLADLFYLHKT